MGNAAAEYTYPVITLLSQSRVEIGFARVADYDKLYGTTNGYQDAR